MRLIGFDRAAILERRGNMDRIIALGKRGTAFADLEGAQLKEVDLNAHNEVFQKTVRSKEQLERRDRGEHQGVLWADSRSYVTPHPGIFWLGHLAEALRLKLVQKARISVSDGVRTEELVGYVRPDYTTKTHKYIAVETVLGRVESKRVPKENRQGMRNDPHHRKILGVSFCSMTLRDAAFG